MPNYRDLVDSAIEQFSDKVEDYFSEYSSIPDGSLTDEWINDIVDGLVPIYDYDVIETALTNIDLARTSPDSGGGDTPLDGIRYNIYEFLRDELFRQEESIIDSFSPKLENCYRCGQSLSYDEAVWINRDDPSDVTENKPDFTDKYKPSHVDCAIDEAWTTAEGVAYHG